MTKRKLKPFVVPALYGLTAVIFVFSIYMVQLIIDKASFTPSAPVEDTDYVDNEILDFNNQLPVVSDEIIILRPYLATDVSIAKNYYDYQAEASEQENAIIYYEDTYMQNSGVDYKSENTFDVVAILDGTVTSVKEDDILGNIIQIKHTNDIISVYQSLSEVSVKENDTILAGQKIGKSGESNINKDIGNHLHFELYYKGQIVNPELYYDKSIKDL